MANVNKTQNRQLQASESRAGLRICLLGPVAIEIDGMPVVIASKKARALLGYLVQRGGTDVARSTITGLLWSERGEEQACARRFPNCALHSRNRTGSRSMRVMNQLPGPRVRHGLI